MWSECKGERTNTVQEGSGVVVIVELVNLSIFMSTNPVSCVESL